MPNFDLAMMNYVKLAELSHRKRQQLGSDKLLVLAGAAACKAGCLSVAGRCRELILRHNPRHQLAKFETLTDALRSEDFPLLVRRLEKLCSAEQAEFLAAEWGVLKEPAADSSASELEADVLSILKAFDA